MIDQLAGIDIFKLVNQNLNQFNPGALNYVTQILSSVTIKVGLYIMIFFAIQEIASIYERANASNDGIVVPQTMLMAWVRLAFAGACVAGAYFIFNFIVLIAVGGGNLLHDMGSANFNIANVGPPDMASGSNLADILLRADFLVTLLNWLVEALIDIVAGILIWVLIIVRFLEMYVLLALAPIPLASLASHEHQGIAIGYIKHFAAYAFQGLVLLVVVGVYGAVQKNINDPSTPWHLDKNPLAGDVVAVVFLVMIWRTLAISKKLFGVGI